VLVGAREPLIAFNVNLRGTLEDARAIAAAVRERDGGLRGVRALGLELASGLVQISMNVEDYAASPLQVIVAAIADHAQARGVEVAGCELVGLAPAAALLPAAAERLGLAQLDSSQVLELRLHEP
jgi:glutamate formiminotransferase